MNIRIPPVTAIAQINTADMHNRRAVKLEQLHREKLDKTDDYYRVKQQDFNLNRTHLRDWEMDKSIEEVVRYTNLRNRVEYARYRYSQYLGKHIDVLA